MTTQLLIRPANEFDCYDLARTMRQADKDELRAACGEEPYPILKHGLDTSKETWVATIDGEVLCMWGVVGGDHSILGARVGLGWLLTSDLIEQHKRLFWKACNDQLTEIFERWDILYNAIDCRHTKAVRWAQHLGFQLEDPEPYGVEGLPFRRFTVDKEVLRCVHR